MIQTTDGRKMTLISQICESRRHYFLIFLYIIVVTRLWIMPLGSSLWLDETSTYWNVMKGISEVIRRCSESAGQFQLYMFITTISTSFFGLNEIGVRAPSVLASIGSSLLLFKLGRRFADAETGMFAAILFACIPNIYMYASNARSYALVLLCAILSLWELVRLHDTGKWKYLVGYTTASAAMVYMHYITIPFFAILQLYSVIMYDKKNIYKIITAHLSAIIIIFPLLATIVITGKDSKSLSFLATPNLNELFSTLLNTNIIVTIIICGIFRLALNDGFDPFHQIFESRIALYITAWYILPIISFYIISVFTEYKLFLDRYFIYAYPALALLLASSLQKIRHNRLRYSSLLALCIISLFSVGTDELYPSIHREDWRGALQRVRSIVEPAQIPVLFNSGLIETVHSGWGLHSVDNYLLSPLAPYPVNSKITSIPVVLNAQSKSYLEKDIVSLIDSFDRFVVVMRANGISPGVDEWIQKFSMSRGFKRSAIGSFPGVITVLYEKK